MRQADPSSILEEWFTDVSNEFMREGNCVGMDTRLFFPYKGESIREALQACNGTPATLTEPEKPVCPVREQCLEYAMSLPMLCVGVWGGTSQKQRRVMRAEQIAAEKAFEKAEAEKADVKHEIHLRALENGIRPELAELVRLVSEVHRGAA